MPAYRIAVVKDGDSWYFDAAIERLRKELKALAEDRYTFEFKTLNAGHDPVKVRTLLRQASADPSVHVLYASGVMATENAKRMAKAERTKPILGGAVQFSDTAGLISPEGTSSVPQFTFITEPKRVSADLALLKRLTGEKTIHVAIDRLVYSEFDRFDEARRVMEQVLGVRLAIHTINATAAEALSVIPENAKALYMGVQPRMAKEDRRALYEKLAERGTVTVTMLGPEELELGAMAGQAPNNQAAISRRAALNIHQMLQGVPTANLPVYLPVQDQLFINAATARTTGWSPTYELALEANLINEESRFQGAPITLEEAMDRAARNNADVLVAQEEEQIQQQNVRIARSSLLPQASVEATRNGSRFFDRISSQAADYSHAGSYGLQLRQVLFNDELATNARAQQRSAAAASLDRFSSQLDAIDAAAAAYLNVLSARSLYHIEKDNLRLTQNNLQLSKLRTEIGSTEPSEVFRWEQDAARAKAQLLQRETDRANAVVAFNRTIGEARESQWNFTD
ncbi:MAG: TolC family protein, partial [Verrucomicrobiota bacterium]